MQLPQLVLLTHPHLGMTDRLLQLAGLTAIAHLLEGIADRCDETIVIEVPGGGDQ